MNAEAAGLQDEATPPAISVPADQQSRVIKYAACIGPRLSRTKKGKVADCGQKGSMSELKNEVMRRCLRRSVDWTSFLAIFLALLLSLVLASCAFAQDTGHSGFDVSQLDRSVDPCVDFYQFSCGGWRAKHPLPPDKGRYNRYDEMAESNKNKLREILEAAPQPGTPRDSPSRQVGDYYAACIDESAAEKKGTQPLAPYLSKIAALHDKRAALTLMASLDDEGIPTLFSFSSAPDLHQSSMMIA